jgi:hypothetical protein
MNKLLISELLNKSLNELETDKPNNEVGGSNYDKIAAILKNDIINTAAICEIVLGDKEASNRSLFRKKLEREPNDSGSVYSFSDEELTKISNALMNFSSQIRKSIGKKK